MNDDYNTTYLRVGDVRQKWYQLCDIRWLVDTAGNVSVLCVVGDVSGVTQLHDVVYIVCLGSSTILRFNATTHQRLTDIVVEDMRWPTDIVACERTSQLYVADDVECVWRVSSDGEDIKRRLPKSPSDTFIPWTLSVTSTRRLVTTKWQTPINWYSSTQTAMNWDVFKCWTTVLLQLKTTATDTSTRWRGSDNPASSGCSHI